jgi:hypothetical protein
MLSIHISHHVNFNETTRYFRSRKQFFCKHCLHHTDTMSAQLSVFVSFSGVADVEYTCDANDRVSVLFERVFSDLTPTMREQGI